MQSLHDRLLHLTKPHLCAAHNSAAVCSALPPPVNRGTWPESCRNKTAGYECQALCNAGFRLPPMPTATCRQSGNWSPVSGRCQQRGEQLCGPHDGPQQKGWVPRWCLPSYCFLRSSEKAHRLLCWRQAVHVLCLTGAKKWQLTSLANRCIQLSSAADPVPCLGEPNSGVNPPNAQWPGNCADMPHTGVCYAVCNPGFQSEPRPSAACEDGLWQPVIGRCQPAKAAQAEDAVQAVATATASNTTAGELLLFAC